MKCGRFDGFGKFKFEVKLEDGHQKVPYRPWLSVGGVNCLVVFPTILILIIPF